MQAMESAFDVCTEDLLNQTVKLEEMEKKAGNAEGEVSSLRSRLILLQENNEKQGAVGQGHLGAGRRLSEGGLQCPQENGAGERRLLQRGDHRQPGQAALRVEDHPH